MFLVIALASVLCSPPHQNSVSSLVQKFEKASSKRAQKPDAKLEIPDAFQVVKNGKPVNGNFVAQRSKITGKMQWEQCKTPLN